VRIPFGKYRGHEVEALPDGYLRWLVTVELREPLRAAVWAELVQRTGGGPLVGEAGRANGANARQPPKI